jgi:hypothetical protein
MNIYARFSNSTAALAQSIGRRSGLIQHGLYIVL